MKMPAPLSLLALLALSSALLLSSSPAWAATLSVGPGATYTSIMDAWAMVQPGDVIEVAGGQTYTGTFLLDSGHSGTAKAPVTLRGLPVNGQRPILKGIGPGMWDNMVVFLNADHFVMESFEVIGNDNDTDYCLVQREAGRPRPSATWWSTTACTRRGSSATTTDRGRSPSSTRSSTGTEAARPRTRSTWRPTRRCTPAPPSACSTATCTTASGATTWRRDRSATRSITTGSRGHTTTSST